MKYTSTGSSSVSYTYNADGSLKTITTPTGTVYTFTYDNLGRTTNIQVGTQSLSGTPLLYRAPQGSLV